MSILFDTSVLVAAFVASHPKHEAALRWIKRAKSQEISWCVSAHSIVECYAVLTRLPLTPKLSPIMAKMLIEENIEKSAQIISLSGSEYLTLMKEIALAGLAGGIVYDAILLKAAQKAKAEKILTFNLRDFKQLAPAQTDYIISPDDN